MRALAPATLAWVFLIAPSASPAADIARQEYSQALRAIPNLAHGRMIFTTCAMCHGAEGGGNSQRSVPRIAGQHESVIIRQLVDYRHGKRWDDRMEAFTNRHMLRDSQEIADIAGYVSQIRYAGEVTHGDGTLLEKAALTYERRCRGCHGPRGEGDGAKAVPKLSGQRYEYLLRQMYDATDGRRPNFPTAHLRLLKRMERDDLTGLADFLSRQQ